MGQRKRSIQFVDLFSEVIGCHKFFVNGGDVDFGDFDVSMQNHTTYVLADSVARVRCHHNFYLQDMYNDAVKCSDSGHWDPDIPK